MWVGARPGALAGRPRAFRNGRRTAVPRGPIDHSRRHQRRLGSSRYRGMSPHVVSTRMPERRAILHLLKHREPTLLIGGQSISGRDDVALVALTLLVLDSTHHSVTKLAWFAAARMVPFVAWVLFGGVIVDRFSRRLLLLISDSTRGRDVGARGLHRLWPPAVLRTARPRRAPWDL